MDNICQIMYNQIDSIGCKGMAAIDAGFALMSQNPLLGLVVLGITIRLLPLAFSIVRHVILTAYWLLKLIFRRIRSIGYAFFGRKNHKKEIIWYP